MKTILTVILISLLTLECAVPLSAIGSPKTHLHASSSRNRPTQQYSTFDKADDDVFVVTRDASGNTNCREATQQERPALSRQNKDALGMHQVNHTSDKLAPQTTVSASAGLTIILRATQQLEANPSAKQALIRAASNWEKEVTTPVTIYVDVDFGPTNFGQPWAPNLLGATSSTAITANYQNVRSHLIPTASSGLESQTYNLLPDTVVPTDLGDASPTMSVSSSIARAIGLLEPTASATDPAPQISINSNVEWDFDASDGVFGKYDFETLATHELGHALGFTSRSGAGVTPPQLTVWDLFRFRSHAVNVTTDARIMTTGGDQVFFAGTGTRELKLSTGGPNGTAGDMRQSSHWIDDSIFFDILGVMDPTLGLGQHLTISPYDLLAIDRFGYTTVINTAPTILEFVDQFPSAIEGSSINLSIRRRGDTTGVSTVDYTTRDIAGAYPCDAFDAPSASSRCDYITTLGTLRFAPNETIKTITVPIIDDTYQESLDRFWIRLSHPTGATLWTTDDAQLSIIDNEPGPIPVIQPNPLDTASFFVREHYIDFFSREPDAGGLAFWTNEITQCGTNVGCLEVKRINVSGAFFISTEFQETGYLVYRLYKTAFGNLAGAPVPVTLNPFLRDTQAVGQGVRVGIGDWQTQLENNKQAFALEFVKRPEFIAAFPTTYSADQFVSQLDTNAGGVLSAADKTNLIAILTVAPVNSGKRAQVLRAVAEDQDLKNAEFNKAFVLMQYFGYLRRNPNDAPDSDFSGFNFWLNKLNSFGGNFVNAEMVKAFITSAEYRKRFGV